MREQERVKIFVKRHNLEAKPEFRLLDMASELGEVAKELLIASKYGKSECLYTENIKRELGDLLFSLICLANTCNVDLDEALDMVLKGYEERMAKKQLKGKSEG